MSDTVASILKSGTFPPVVLLFGEEELMVHEAAETLYRAACAEDASGMNSDMLDGEGMSLDAILTMARSFPMMGDRRVIWVRRFDKVTGGKDKRGTDIMASYLASPSPTTFLLLTGSYPSLDGMASQMQKSESTAKRKIASQKAPLAALLANAAWIEYPRMREQGVRTWLRKRAASMKPPIEMDEEASAFLVARCGTSIRELSLELDKVITYIGSKTTISTADVSEVVGATRSATIFDLQRAIGKADAAAAYTILSRMLATERQEMLIVSMLARYFTSLYRLIDARSMQDRTMMAKACAIAPFAVPEYLDALDTLGPQRVERALLLLARCDSTMKSAPTEPVIVMQSMLAQLLVAPPKR